MYHQVSPFIQTGDTMPMELVTDLFRWVEQLPNDEAQRMAAVDIAPEIANFLPSFALDRFIAAEITSVEAESLAASRKAIASRGAVLLPAVLRHFGVLNHDALYSVVSRVLDCVEDYPHVRRSPHQKKAKKQTREVANEVLQITTMLIEKLTENELLFAGEFIQQIEAEDKLERIDAVNEFDEFNRRLELLAFTVKSTLVRDEIGENVFFVRHNMTHTHIVRAAYEIAHWNGQPKFLTTPGSDFASVCALLFELATGEADISMAGAINKLARSEWRQQFEKEEVEYQLEHSDVDEKTEIDNFHFRKYEAKQQAEEANKWLNLTKSGIWSESDILHITRRATYCLESVTKLLSENGPFILWASQMPQDKKQESHLESLTFQSELLDLRIKIGKLRRGKAGS
jgi:hypothetical protein